MSFQKRKQTDFTMKEKEIVDAAKNSNPSKLAKGWERNGASKLREPQWRFWSHFYQNF